MIVRICSKCRNGILEPWADVETHDAPTWRFVFSQELGEGPICGGAILEEFPVIEKEKHGLII